MGAKHATAKDIIRINEKLAVVIRKTEDGCAYIDRNVTDATVAKELGIAQASVAHIRKDLYGLLQAPHERSGAPNARIDELEKKIEALQQIVMQQAKTLVELVLANDQRATEVQLGQEKHNALCTQISLNKVLDVRKLMYEIPIPLRPLANGRQDAQSQIYRR